MPYQLSFDDFPPCMREFANYKRAIQGCSAKTVEEYMTDLRTFARYLIVVENGLELSDETLRAADISELTLEYFGKVLPSQIMEYLSYSMDGRGNNENTRSRKLSAIKSFYKFYVNKLHRLEVNPAIDIETPKKKKTLPKHLSLDESLKLLGAVSSDETNPYRRRDFCILTLFLNCGMRLSELCGIDVSDIDREYTSMRVVGKGNKERVIYLNEACRSAIISYLPERQSIVAKVPNCERQALFLSRLGKRISNKTVQWIVKKYLGAAGLEFMGYSTHKLRHTAATLMYQTGDVDIRVLKDILGHEQLTTTQIYTHISDKSMKAAMDKNPLSSVMPVSNEARPLEDKDTNEEI